MRSEHRTARIGGRPATSAVIPGRYALSVGDPRLPTPDGWRWVRLTDLARLETGHTPSRRKPEYWNGDIPWVGIRDATQNDGRVIYDTAQHTNELGIAHSAARVLPPHTVCLSRTASVGYVVVMGRSMATSQDFVNWICSEHIHWRFLAYVFLAEAEDLLRFASGTTHQTIYFPEVKAFHVCLPPMDEQRRIVAMLGSLDDKIESNRRLNSLLADISRTLHTRCLDGTSWTVPLGKVADVIDCLHSTKPAKRDEGQLLLQLHNIREDGLMDLETEYLIAPEDYLAWTRRMEAQADDCVITNVGRVGAVGRVPRIRAALGRNMTGVRCKPSWPHPACLIESLLSDRMRREVELLTDSGTVMNALNVRNIPRLPMPDADQDTWRDLENVLDPIWRLREHLLSEARALAGVRHALLPRLVSGEITFRTLAIPP